MLASKLENTFPIPMKPHYAVSDEARWSAVEEKLGLQLPTDYKVFIGIYGTGTVGDFINIANPFTTYKPANLFYNIKWIIEAEQPPYSYIKLPLYPEPSGLIPFARTYNGDVLYWQTQDEPNSWTLYIQMVRSQRHEQYAMTMSDFFIELIRSRYRKITIPGQEQDPTMENTILKRRPFKNSIFRKWSWMMSRNIDPKKPFVSLWVNLERSFGNLKEKLKNTSHETNGEISKAALETLLKRHGFDLETDELTERLQIWQQEQSIEIVGNPDVYLRVLNQQDP